MKRSLYLPLVALLLFSGFTAFIPTASALQTYTEDFSDDSLGQLPSSNFYVFTSVGSAGGTFVTDQKPITPGNKNFIANDTSATDSIDSRFTFSPVGVDFCNHLVTETQTIVPSLSFSWRVSDLPGAGSAATFGIVTTAGTGDNFQASILSTGELFMEIGSTQVFTGLIFAEKTWYNWTISVDECGTTGATAQFRVFAHEQGQSFTASDPESCTGCEYNRFHAETNGAATIVGLQIDNLVLSNVNDPPPDGLDAAAVSDAINEIAGFDLDQSGSNVIVRFDNVPPGPEGRDVLSLEALSLERQDGGHIDTECDDMEHGVMAHQNALMFVKCDDGDPTHFWIRNPGLGTLEENCGDECPADIEMGCCGSVSDAGGDNVNELYELTAFPIDYSFRQTNFAGQDFASIGMGYSSTAGVIGVQIFTGQNNGEDDWNFDEVTFSGSSAPDQICIADDDGIFYLQAVDSLATTKFFRIDFSGPIRPQPTLVPVATLPTFSPASALSCAGDRTLIGVERTGALVNDQLYLIDRATGTPIWSKVYPDGTDVYEGSPRGVALSGDGKFFAYSNEVDGLIYIGDADDGNVTGQVSLESGFIVGMEFDFSAQNLYVAYNDGVNGAVYRYNMVDAGLVPPTNTIGGEGGAPLPTSAAPGEGPFGGAPAQVGGALGIGTFGGGLFLAALTVLMFAVASFNEGGNVRLFGYVGAVVGFFVAWGFGFISTGAVFAIIVICGLIWYVSRGSSTGG